MLGLAVAEGKELAVERLADPRECLEAEVLFALLDARDGTLARRQRLGEVRLGHALVAPRVPDEGSDAGKIVV